MTDFRQTKPTLKLPKKKGDKQINVYHLFDYQPLTLFQRINIHPH
jgi:hypothetical protein